MPLKAALQGLGIAHNPRESHRFERHPRSFLVSQGCCPLGGGDGRGSSGNTKGTSTSGHDGDFARATAQDSSTDRNGRCGLGEFEGKLAWLASLEASPRGGSHAAYGQPFIPGIRQIWRCSSRSMFKEASPERPLLRGTQTGRSPPSSSPFAAQVQSHESGETRALVSSRPSSRSESVRNDRHDPPPSRHGPFEAHAFSMVDAGDQMDRTASDRSTGLACKSCYRGIHLGEIDRAVSTLSSGPAGGTPTLAPQPGGGGLPSRLLCDRPLRARHSAPEKCLP